MNWVGAIEVNQAVLVRIVATLVAMMDAHRASPWMPIPVHRAVVRLLRPAESAVRRLILITARKGMGVPAMTKPAPVRPWPEGLVIAPAVERKRRASFRLFDPIHAFAPFQEEAPVSARKTLPSIRTVDFAPLIPAFLRGGAPTPDTAPAGFIRIRMISGRVAALQFALANIPREAKRLMRTLAREEPEFPRLVLRPGPPPGGVKKPKDEIHLVLKECHALARYALSENSS